MGKHEVHFESWVKLDPVTMHPLVEFNDELAVDNGSTCDRLTERIRGALQAEISRQGVQWPTMDASLRVRCTRERHPTLGFEIDLPGFYVERLLHREMGKGLDLYWAGAVQVSEAAWVWCSDRRVASQLARMSLRALRVTEQSRSRDDEPAVIQGWRDGVWMDMRLRDRFGDEVGRLVPVGTANAMLVMLDDRRGMEFIPSLSVAGRVDAKF